MFNGQSNNRFGIKQNVHEAPLAIGALAGGLLGSAGVAGLTIMSGIALGSLAGGVLGGMFNQKAPKVQSAQNQQQAAAAETPALPAATQMPATPMTPTATPVALNGGDLSKPQDAAEASPATTEEVAKGELEKKRRGRLSTILTTPQSRLNPGDTTDQVERLGG